MISNQPSHFVVLDFYRFLAAFGVLLLHFSEFAAYTPIVGAGFTLHDFALFVDFFFILSGFVIGINYFDRVGSVPEIFKFLRRRLARIYPLHALTLAIYLLPAIAGHSANPEKYSPTNIISQILLYQSWLLNQPAPFNHPAWSISVEWGLYLLFPAFAFAAARRSGLTLLAIVATIGFASVQYSLTHDLIHPPEWSNIIGLIRAIPSFVVGILISRICRDVPLALGIPLGLLTFCAATVAMVLHASPWVIIALFSLVVFLSAAGSQAEFNYFEKRVFRTLGDASYGLYMTHSITLTLAVEVIWPHVSTEIPPLWYGLLIGAATTVLAITIFRLFEKPAKEFLSGSVSSSRLATLP